MKLTRSAIALALGLALTGVGAQAQTTQGTSPSTAPEATAVPGTTMPGAQPSVRDTMNDSKLNQTDRRFMENAIQGSHAEIEGSRLALEKTKSAEVKQFAEMMIKDHEKMAQEASKLATEKGLTPPDGPSVIQKTEITGLKALSGGAFDAMYINRIGVAAHESTVEMFEKAAQEAEDPDVKAMAEKTLPKLRKHLEMARAIDAKQAKQ